MNIKRSTWVIIIIAIVVLVVLLWLFWPRANPKPVGGETSYPAMPSTSTVSQAKAKPTETQGLTLDSSQSAALVPILKKEDAAITKILASNKSKADKANEIRKVRAADQEEIKKLLPPAQYRRLILIQSDHDGEALAQTQ